MKTEVKIDGMHCEHCVAAAEKALLGLGNIKKVKVSLKKGMATIHSEKPLDNEAIKNSIAEAGFTVTDIQ